MWVILSLALVTAAVEPVVPVPAEVRASLHLSPHYTKLLPANGFAIVASDKVADPALREAKAIVTSMLVNHPEYFGTLSAAKVRLAVMAPTELTTAIPEHSDLTPKDYWDRRARGLGATAVRPAVSCAEENLLDEPGDPYSTESICVHEFAHTVHEMVLSVRIKSFDRRLHAAFRNAQAKGIWKNTYAMTNEKEYWAEAVQSWFDTNRHDDAEHGKIDTREEVQREDPLMAALIVEALGKVSWRYVKPSLRTEGQRAELGPMPAPLPQFSWPTRIARVVAGCDESAATNSVALRSASVKMPRSLPNGESSTVIVENRGRSPIEWAWLDFKGALTHYATIAPGASETQSTYVGHVWVISQEKKRLGWIAAPEGCAKLIVP
jgi:hypothetical protein